MHDPAVDFSAKERHFLGHLAPLWHAIPEEDRGRFYITPGDFDYAVARGIDPDAVTIGLPTKTSKRATVVASWGDLRIIERTRRRAVLSEHGAGQSYSSRHTSYVGGTGRDRVRLFLVPNFAAAERNRRYYPRIPNAVIGSPMVDDLARIPLTSDATTVAISFHWRALNGVCPEAGSAVDHYVGHLPRVAAELHAEGVTLIAHAHPRILDELGPKYAEAGIELVPSFLEVVARADLYAVDNSSTLFEFAALGRPVVVLNSPNYRREVAHGLRFWSEADVGLQVDRPEDLAAGILYALEDPPALRRSREAAVARVYAVTDGTSADRGALAVRSLARGRCLVCGAAHAVCGRPSTENPVDILEDPAMNAGRKRLYRNPEHPTSFLKLNDRDAARMGLLPEASTETVAPAPEPAPGPEVPKGAMTPAGPTHRARTAKDKARKEPAPAPEAEEDEPKDKAEPAPRARTRRRRQAAD